MEQPPPVDLVDLVDPVDLLDLALGVVGMALGTVLAGSRSRP